MTGNINIVILAGGASSRFWPLNEKNIYTFFGHTPFDYHLEKLKILKPKKIVIVTNGKIKVNYPEAVSVRQEGSGMAGAVNTALRQISPDEELLIIGANDYYEDDLYDSLQEKRDELKQNNKGAIAAHKVNAYFPGGYLKLDNDKITGIVEKPPENNTPSNFVNMVFHYFPKAHYIKDSLTKSESVKDDLYEVAIDNLIKSGFVFNMILYEGEWKSIKYPWHVLDVMDFYLKQINKSNISPQASISEKATVKGSVIIEEGVKIYEGAVINGPAFIGKNSVIANGALVRESMVGENCVIGYETEVARSYLKNDVWLHKNYVGDSILESNVSFGSGTVTGNLRLDEQNISMEVKGKVVDTKRNKLGAIIGSNVRVGINTSLMPGVRIGSETFVGPGLIIDKDIPENSYVKAENTYKITKNKFDISKTSRVEIRKAL